MKRIIAQSSLIRCGATSLAASIAFISPLAMYAQNPAEELLALKRPLVIAHRGYSLIAPENTIPAFELGKIAGADLIELDYFTSADGVAICFHDRTLDRTSNVIAAWGKEGLRVSDVSAKALQALDVGSWFSPQFAGLTMPTLIEALDAIQANGGVTLIERKEGPAEDIARILRERNLVNQVVVQAFDWDFLAAVNQLIPEQVLGALGPVREYHGRAISREQRFLSPYWVDEALKSGARVIGWNRQVTAEAVAYAQSKGLKVWIYTINEAPLAEQLLNMGVDGIITDNTSLIWRTMALRARGL